MFAYNTSKQSTTSQSPFEILYGKPARMPIDLRLNTQREQFESVNEYTMKVNKYRENISVLVQDKMEKAQERQIKNYNHEVCEKYSYRIGNLILIRNHTCRTNHTSKFENKFLGPYQVLNDLLYKIKHFQDKTFCHLL